MKHTFEQKVYYADTDSYGVVWHGSYLRWMEMGRCQWCDEAGLDLIELARDHDITIPVVGVNIRYKSPAKVYDNMVIETECVKFSSLSATFKQVIKSKATGKPFVEAEVEVVATSTASGKLYRRLPAKLADAFVELGVSS